MGWTQACAFIILLRLCLFYVIWNLFASCVVNYVSVRHLDFYYVWLNLYYCAMVIWMFIYIYMHKVWFLSLGSTYFVICLVYEMFRLHIMSPCCGTCFSICVHLHSKANELYAHI